MSQGSVNNRTGDLNQRIRDVVRSYWGFDSLRPLQSQAIRAGLAHQDSLVVLPTGGGKSLCYQVPPLIENRMDIVVSPLISLMRDQVAALTQNGYPAAAVHSNLTPDERRAIREGIRARKYRLLFVSPERIVSPQFIDFLSGQEISSFAIDEAHCISQWGHDFRPEYRQLALLKRHFPQASVHAYTATATQRVREDIIERLSLRDANVLVGIFDRPNLTYRIVPRMDKELQTLDIIRRHAGEALIAYCLSRKDTERLAEFLIANNVNAAAYHAGMDAADRSRVQDEFAAERLDVVCATVAFGMGIDRSNVRCVIHATMPKSVEHYQQETGRAGRDGLEAECVLLYSPGDVVRWKRLIAMSAENAGDADAVITAGIELLDHMSGLCSTIRCRHKALSEYFGQAYEKPNCGACDVCFGEIEVMQDSTTIARKILSCVYRLEQRWGIGYVVDVLRGANTEQVRQRGHEQVSTWGILREIPEKALTQLVYQLVELGHLARTGDDRPVVKLTGSAMRVLRGEDEVRFTKPASEVHHGKAEEDAWEGVDRGLFDALRGVRRELAEERSVPAFVIFGDASLRDMARRRPSTLAAFRGISGVGEKKLADLGEAFVNAIVDYCKAHDIEMDQTDPRGATETVVRVRRKNVQPNAPKDQAVRMLRGGAAVSEVVAATGRAESTVWGYLEELVAIDPSCDISHWVDEATYERVRSAAPLMEGASAKPVFEALNEEVPYGVIRLVIAHLQTMDSTHSG
jgi:ATP-dependent DNA helicase RecQ